MAHKFVFETPHLTAEAISSVAMPELAQYYKVLGTPHTVLNGTIHLKGRITEYQLLNAVRSSASNSSS